MSPQVVQQLLLDLEGFATLAAGVPGETHMMWLQRRAKVFTTLKRLGMYQYLKLTDTIDPYLKRSFFLLEI